MTILVDLSNKKISEHFTYKEVVFSADAQRNNIDNFVYDPEFVLNAKALADNVLEKIRDHYYPIVGHGININSWYRCEELERNICRNSFLQWCKKGKLDPSIASSWDMYFLKKSHPKCCAADIEIVGVSNVELFDWIKNNLKFDQLILEFVKPSIPDSGWVHVSWSRTNNRRQSFTIN